MHDATYLFAGAMFLTVAPDDATHRGRGWRRAPHGLRPVELDLSTAYLVHTGCSWWRELFFCGPCLQLRDANGRRLYLESWLWEPTTRAELLEATTAEVRS